MSKVPFVSQISSDPSGPPSWMREQELKDLIIQDTPKLQRIVSIRSRSEQFTQSALRVQIEAELAGKLCDNCDHDNDNTYIGIPQQMVP